MAKPPANKQPMKPAQQHESKPTGADAMTPNEKTAASEVSPSVPQPKAIEPPPAVGVARKDTAPARTKKQPVSKNGSILPSAYKLEQLKAAVSAAGNAEQLLLILNHVEEAGGRGEVIDSIETYRMLKSVLED